MECEDGKWRPVAFLFKSLNETERNYEIHDKEMLVVIKGLENWRHLLESTKCYELRFFELDKSTTLCYDRCLLETAWTWVKSMTI